MAHKECGGRLQNPPLVLVEDVTARFSERPVFVCEEPALTVDGVAAMLAVDSAVLLLLLMLLADVAMVIALTLCRGPAAACVFLRRFFSLSRAHG